jgi:hypothetical protein
MNREFVDKMIEAKRLEKEAFMTVLPENVRGHVDVIEKEMKAILMESMSDCILNVNRDKKDAEPAKSKVHKVEIN